MPWRYDPRTDSWQETNRLPKWVEREIRSLARLFVFTLAVFIAVILFLIFVILVTPANASDDEFPVPTTAVLQQQAIDHAKMHWEFDPCAGQVDISWDYMGDGVNARARWWVGVAGDPTTFSQCTVTFNLDTWWDTEKYCTVMEHEYGHLGGHEHVDDPTDLMSAYYTDAASDCLSPYWPPRPPVKGKMAMLQTKHSDSYRLRYRARRAMRLTHRL